ncbi:MAG: hypothetical protein ACLVBJ_09965 [Pilosibacter sp.]
MSLSTTTNTSGRTPEQDAVICALIGLARAAEAKESRLELLRSFLQPWHPWPRDPLSSSAAKTVEQIHKQKSIVSPDCAACPSPCGRTADFLPKDLNCTDNGLFEDRNRLLAELSQHAKEEWKRILAEQEDPEITRLFMDCVFMAGYAYEKELFAPYFEKLAALND